MIDLGMVPDEETAERRFALYEEVCNDERPRPPRGDLASADVQRPPFEAGVSAWREGSHVYIVGTFGLFLTGS